VENEGQPGDRLSPAQVENAAHILAALHVVYGVPLVATDDPNGAGLGWHGMGGADWGGHLTCGESFRDQRAEIIARAEQLLGAPAAPAPAAAPVVHAPASHVISPVVLATQRAVRVTADGAWGPGTDGAVAAVRDAVYGHLTSRDETMTAQRAVGTTVDGIWGKNSAAAARYTVMALQGAWGVAVDGQWGRITDAEYQRVRAAWNGRY
jgi:hypothetical protein